MGAVRIRGGLQINNPIYNEFLMKHQGLHVNCLDKELCFCEHNCEGTHSTIEWALNAQTVSSPAKIKAQPKEEAAN